MNLSIKNSNGVIHTSSNDIVIFTDGASRGNPGPGGFAAIVILPSQNDEKYELGIKNYEVREIGGREEHTTNNRMELRAAIEAFSCLSSLRIKPARRSLGAGGGKARPTERFQPFGRGLSIVLHSDSSYLVNGITRWVHAWQKNGWKTKEKKDVENRDLWEQLLRYSAIYRTIKWEYVGGHVGVVGNTRCDEIATAFADGKKQALYEGSLENYPLKNISDLTHDGDLAQAKDAKRARSSAQVYSYVSEVGGRVETHRTWAECEKRVRGKNAKYRKVFSKDEEQKLITEWTPLEMEGYQSPADQNSGAGTSARRVGGKNH